MVYPFICNGNGGFMKCRQCDELIHEGDLLVYRLSEPPAWFHRYCFDRWEHYFGLDNEEE